MLRRFREWWVCLGFSLLQAGQVQAANVVLELQAQVTISGPRIQLQDVANVLSVTGVDAAPELVQGIKETVLGKAPRVGQIAQLTRRELEHALRGVRIAQSLMLDWHGAQAVKIRAAQQTLAANVAVETMQQALSQALATRAKVQAISLAQVEKAVPDIALPLGVVSLAVRPLAHEPLAARMPVWLDVSVDGVFYRSLSLMFAVEAQALPSEDRVVRGAVVALQLVQGAVVLETKAVVQQEAQVGQLVRVRLEPGGELVRARVRSASRVEME
jgi:hypothetical protein